MNIAASIKSLNIAAVGRYLRANGWRLDGADARISSFVKEGPDGQRSVAELPTSESFADFTRRIWLLIEDVAQESGRSMEQIITDILQSDFDIIRLRVLGPGVGAGRVSVSIGDALFRGTRELITAAACAAHEPRRIYGNRKPNDVQEFLKGVKFAAPEAGSFVVVLQTKIPPNIGGMFDTSEDPPFARRATMAFLKASVSARSFAEGNALNPGSMVQPDPEVSANFCEALGRLVDGELTDSLETSFSWASCRAAPQNLPTKVRFQREHITLLTEYSRTLRHAHRRTLQVLEGPVVRLDSEDPAQGGKILLLADGRRVEVVLGPEDYQLAAAVHTEGALLRVRGQIDHNGRRVIQEPQDVDRVDGLCSGRAELRNLSCNERTRGGRAAGLG